MNATVRTPVFGKIQPKSEKTSRKLGVIDINTTPKISIFQENISRKLRYT